MNSYIWFAECSWHSSPTDVTWQIWPWWFRGRNIPALVTEHTRSAEPDIPVETADGSGLAAKCWTVNGRGWGHPAFLSAEPALVTSDTGKAASETTAARACLAEPWATHLAPASKWVVMLTHAEVVRSGKLWRSYVATHFKMLCCLFGLKTRAFRLQSPWEWIGTYFTGHSFHC